MTKIKMEKTTNILCKIKHEFNMFEFYTFKIFACVKCGYILLDEEYDSNKTRPTRTSSIYE